MADVLGQVGEPVLPVVADGLDRDDLRCGVAGRIEGVTEATRLVFVDGFVDQRLELAEGTLELDVDRRRPQQHRGAEPQRVVEVRQRLRSALYARAQQRLDGAKSRRNGRCPGNDSIPAFSVGGPEEIASLSASGSEEIARKAIAMLVNCSAFWMQPGRRGALRRRARGRSARARSRRGEDRRRPASGSGTAG